MWLEQYTALPGRAGGPIISLEACRSASKQWCVAWQGAREWRHMSRLGSVGLLPIGVVLLILGVVLRFDRVVTAISFTLIAFGVVLGILGLINMMSGRGRRNFDDP